MMARGLHRRITFLLDHPAIYPAMLLAGAIFIGSQVSAAAQQAPFAVYDAHAYWLASQADEPYAATIEAGFDDSVSPYKYRYPPPLIQALGLVGHLTFPVFVGAWLTLLFLAFLAMAGRWAMPMLLLFPPVIAELWLGNVNLLIAAAVVLGMKRPAAWAAVAVTKVTPAIGLLWFAFRRDWRALTIAAASTAVVVIASVVVGVDLWADFLEAMGAQASASVNVPIAAIPINLPIRAAIAIAILFVSARTNRAWLVPIAVTMAAPVIWLNVLSILVAMVPILEARGLESPMGAIQRGRSRRLIEADPTHPRDHMVRSEG